MPPGDADAHWTRLDEDFQVEVPVYEWEGRTILRASIGPYKDESHVERLLSALAAIL